MTHSTSRLLARFGIGTGMSASITRRSPTKLSERIGMSARDRRALLVGVASVGFLVAVSRGLPAWRSWRESAYEEATAATTDLARARSLLSVSRAIGDSLDARNDRFLSLAPALLGGESPAAAGATLAGIVSGAAATAGVRIGAVQIRPDTMSSSTFTRVSVRADATGDIAGVSKMLATLERGPTLLAIRSLSIDQSEPAATSDRMEALRISFAVEGLMLSPRSAKLAADSSAADTVSATGTTSSTDSGTASASSQHPTGGEP